MTEERGKGNNRERAINLQQQSIMVPETITQGILLDGHKGNIKLFTRIPHKMIFKMLLDLFFRLLLDLFFKWSMCGRSDPSDKNLRRSFHKFPLSKQIN